MPEQIIRVTQKNVVNIRKMLNSTRENPEKGNLLIYGYCWYKGSDDAEFTLFSNADFYNNRELSSRLDHIHDREWHLRPIPDYRDDKETAFLANWFERLKIGEGYEFNVHGRFTAGRGIWQAGGKTLCLPDVSLFPIAMKSALEHMVRKIDLHRKKYKRKPCGITAEDIGKIVKYAAEDLRTGEILQHNLQAGTDADAFLGIS